MKKVTEEWLKAAADDLRVIEKISSDDYLTHMVAFHAQQCIEKSLKAVIEEHEIGSVRIHNIERLLEIVRSHVKIDAEPQIIEMLDKLYIDARYPGDLDLRPDGKPNLEHAGRFFGYNPDVLRISVSFVLTDQSFPDALFEQSSRFHSREDF
jgi:HEPN domain-containing protein